MEISKTTATKLDAESYRTARSFASYLSEIEAQKGSLCIEGNATCCTADAEVIVHDMNNILEGFRDGTLPLVILEAALIRAAENNERCPFLDENNSCTIYSHRPLICISNDVIRLPQKETLKRVKHMCENRPNGAVVPDQWLGNKLCADCHQRIRQLPKNHPLRKVTVMQILFSEKLVYILNQLHAREEGRVMYTRDIPAFIERVLMSRVKVVSFDTTHP